MDTVNIESGIDPTVAATAEAARVAAATATFNAQATPPVQAVSANATSATPELIGGKFKSQDDLLAAYKALESKLGAPKAPTAQADTTVAPPASTEPGITPPAADPAKLTIDATAAAAQAGFNLADLSSEYVTNGDLKPETYAKLQAAGFGKDVVDVFIEGQKARAGAEQATLFTKAGVTTESVAAMIKWAQTSLPAEDIAAYNEAVNGTTAMKQFALEAMHTRFTRAQGSDPVLFRGERGASTSGDVYRSNQQMLTDMANPLYSKDPAFRADVAAKVARSKLS